MVYGRSSQGNKLKSQDPELVGPFHIMPGLSWQECLGTLANTAEVLKGSLPGGEGLKWRFQGKNENGFWAMKAQLINHKDPDSTIIVIMPPTNVFNCCSWSRLGFPKELREGKEPKADPAREPAKMNQSYYAI